MERSAEFKHQLIAGSISGVLADMITHPLSTIKTRLQCQGAASASAVRERLDLNIYSLTRAHTHTHTRARTNPDPHRRDPRRLCIAARGRAFATWSVKRGL